MTRPLRHPLADGVALGVGGSLLAALGLGWCIGLWVDRRWLGRPQSRRTLRHNPQGDTR